MARRAVIVAGFGCRGAANGRSFEQALAATGVAHVDAFAICADREALIAPLARRMRVPIVAIPCDRIAGIDTPSRSRPSLAARGVGSVAEALALIAAGPDARLLHPRHIGTDRRATCAIAIAIATPYESRS